MIKTVQEVEEKPKTINSANLPVLYFVYEATSLIESSKKDLDKVYDYLVSNPSVKINIMGHTDSKGEADYNKLLSKIRANSIKNYLNNKGIGWSRMKTTGLGESQPVADNKDASGADNSKGRQQNRRVEFEIIQ